MFCSDSYVICKKVWNLASSSNTSRERIRWLSLIKFNTLSWEVVSLCAIFFILNPLEGIFLSFWYSRFLHLKVIIKDSAFTLVSSSILPLELLMKIKANKTYWKSLPLFLQYFRADNGLLGLLSWVNLFHKFGRVLLTLDLCKKLTLLESNWSDTGEWQPWTISYSFVSKTEY